LQVICYIDQSLHVVFLSFIDWHQIYHLQVLNYQKHYSYLFIFCLEGIYNVFSEFFISKGELEIF